MIQAKSTRLLGLLAALLVAAACAGPTATPGTTPGTTPDAGTPGATPGQTPAETPGETPAQTPGGTPGESPTGTYRIGYSNAGGVGNGFREEQVCTAKAEALASGQVSELITIHRNTDAAGQLSDLRDLIAADVDAIVFNPNDANALNPALEEANAAGIRTVAVDAYVTNPDTYNLYNNQEQYAELGATWLFEQLGGEGTVWYMRGFAGHPADTDRHEGFQRALQDYPGIELVPGPEGVHTGWDPAQTTTIANDFIASGAYDEVDGIWTSGMDSWVVDAIKGANKEFVPIVGADLGAFVQQLLNDEEYPGLVGAAVTNTAAVGGAGVNLALKLLNGEQVETDPNAEQPNTVLLTPVLVDNTNEEGQQQLQSWLVEGLDPNWPLGLTIEDWTTYTPEQAIECKGPEAAGQ
ncbi:MAG: substrate-binding domain-containing protein [Chloroflexota bacterium]|nr:substrate-binding domain-containing protein [Chloroflexota bacterium]